MVSSNFQFADTPTWSEGQASPAQPIGRLALTASKTKVALRDGRMTLGQQLLRSRCGGVINFCLLHHFRTGSEVFAASSAITGVLGAAQVDWLWTSSEEGF